MFKGTYYEFEIAIGQSGVSIFPKSIHMSFMKLRVTLYMACGQPKHRSTSYNSQALSPQFGPTFYVNFSWTQPCHMENDEAQF